MNFPGVIYEDEDTIKKLEYAKKYNKPIDGHIPGIKGDDLKKYINAGVSTDHECVDLNEALEKISLGMKIQIREGSAAKNFNSLHTLIKTHNDKVMLCTDDSHPDDLTTIGHIDKIIKMGLNKGHNIIDLLKACILNPKKHYNINLCTLQENDTADIIVVDNLENFKILETYINGEKVFSNNKINFSVEKISNPLNNFKLEKINKTDLLIKNKNTEYKIINVIDGELVTTISKDKSNNEFIYSDTEKDILKIAVINRYKKDSKPIMGFIKNFNLKSGAIASSIAHDSHNVIAVGTNDDNLFKAINIIIENKGGICVVNKNYSDSLKLEIGGLMTSENSESVAKKYTDISNYTKNKLGSKLKSPFMTLSFMALLVIPELKIGDKGLFDFSKFNLTDLFE
jgi:adenine deaminase